MQGSFLCAKFLDYKTTLCYYVVKKSTLWNKVGGNMYDKSQLMRGTLEGAILKILSMSETYGYEILVQLQACGFGEIKEGTIYPLLIRLEKKGIIKGEFKASPLGPDRKYYKLTEEGVRYMESFQESWSAIREAMDRLWQKGGNV